MAWAKITEDNIDYAQKDGEGGKYTQEHCQELINNSDQFLNQVDGVIANQQDVIDNLNNDKTRHQNIKADFEAAKAVF